MSCTVNLYQLLLETAILSIDSMEELTNKKNFATKEDARDYLNEKMPVLLERFYTEHEENIHLLIAKDY
ncbi:hypothetical protein NRIC_11590 [Enterococcus florum]|uniref:Uncharacterized protein n=1 Tax=Enterococcus florum TaxID=2480627 RepID=A0A4P5PBF1_9ENTE|nr:hypothetical protein [Enterococcus florum]GCF93268.1 hypothetical protein NRIC_11590 [Enterococcus florum]